MSEIVWSGEQESAISAVKGWLDNKNRNQIFRLFGYAGTGKTTLAKHLATLVKGDVLFACFTGKAATASAAPAVMNALRLRSQCKRPLVLNIPSEVVKTINEQRSNFDNQS